MKNIFWNFKTEGNRKEKIKLNKVIFIIYLYFFAVQKIFFF